MCLMTKIQQEVFYIHKYITHVQYKKIEMMVANKSDSKILQ